MTLESKVKLSKKGLIADLEAGLTRPQIAEKYDLSEGMIKKALKDCGLEKKRAVVKGYILVDDDDEVETKPEPATEA